MVCSLLSPLSHNSKCVFLVSHRFIPGEVTNLDSWVVWMLPAQFPISPWYTSYNIFMICNHLFCRPSLLMNAVPWIKMNVLLCDNRFLRVSVCGTWQQDKRTLCCWLMETVISPYCTTAESRCWRALTMIIPSPGPTPRRPPFCPSAWMFVQTVMKVYSVDTVIFFLLCIGCFVK